jgi:hypothetical protein
VVLRGKVLDSTELAHLKELNPSSAPTSTPSESASPTSKTAAHEKMRR